MLSLEQGRTAIRRDVGRDLEHLDGLDEDDWRTPTRLEGWTVRDLAQHLVWGQQLQSEGWRRLGQASATPHVPEEVTTEDPGSIITELRAGNDSFLQRLDNLTEADLAGPCPMPYGVLPAGVVLQVAVMEAGVHRSDLEAALGGAGTTLEEDTLDAIFTLLPGTLAQMAMAADELPAPGVALRLEVTDGPAFGLRRGEDGWAAAEEVNDASYSIRGAGSTIALFALGRIPLEDPSLAVEGDLDLASRFKQHFPGP